MDIKEKVESLIRTYHTNNPFDIVRELNIHILYGNFGQTWGCCQTYNRSQFIHINNTIPEEYQRYTCAHELGHALLHKGISTPYLKRYTLFSIGRIERQANTFAVELLLPDDFIKEYPYCSLEHLAQSVGIPAGMEVLKIVFNPFN